MGQFVTETVTEEIIALKARKKEIKKELNTRFSEDIISIKKMLKKELIEVKAELKAYATILNAITSEKETDR